MYNRRKLISNWIDDDELKEQKTLIELLLSKTERDGIVRVLTYLDQSGFYTAPAGTEHYYCPGGLACISWVIYIQARTDDWYYRWGFDEASLAICALLHAVSSTEAYRVDASGYVVVANEETAMNPGKRSIEILMDLCHFQLTEEEKLIMRWLSDSHDNLSDADAKAYQSIQSCKMYQRLLLMYQDRINAGVSTLPPPDLQDQLPADDPSKEPSEEDLREALLYNFGTGLERKAMIMANETENWLLNDYDKYDINSWEMMPF